MNNVNGIKIDKNKLSINGKVIKFNYDIREIKERSNQVIVLLSIPFNMTEIDNVYSVSLEGEINWRVESLNKINPSGNNMPYENMYLKKDELTVSDFYGRRYFIDITNGSIIKDEGFQCIEVDERGGIEVVECFDNEEDAIDKLIQGLRVHKRFAERRLRRRG